MQIQSSLRLTLIHSPFFILLRALVSRDLRARYRRSILGFGWAILQPLTLMVLFSLLERIVNLGSDGTPYPIFSYAALVPWTFFANGVSRCGPSISANAGLIKKMAIAREVFPTAAVLTALFDFLMASLVLAGMMVYYGVPFTGALVWLPLLVGLTGLLAWGLGLGLASVATFRHDFTYATPFLLQALLYATPVIYPLSRVPERWRDLYQLNPLVGLIQGYRTVILDGQAPDVALLGLSALVTLAVCAVTLPFFRFMSQYFADVL